MIHIIIPKPHFIILQDLVLRPFVLRLFGLRRLPIYISLFTLSHFRFKALWLFYLHLFKPFF